jgi:hypothetical protein
MKTPPRPRLVFLRVTAAAAVLAFLAVAFAMPGKHGPDLPTASGTALTAPGAAGRQTDDPRPAAAEEQLNSFALDTSTIGSLPWNGLKTSEAGGSAGVGFANPQISATPAPVAILPIEPVLTDGPEGGPGR